MRCTHLGGLSGNTVQFLVSVVILSSIFQNPYPLKYKGTQLFAGAFQAPCRVL